MPGDCMSDSKSNVITAVIVWSTWKLDFSGSINILPGALVYAKPASYRRCCLLQMGVGGRALTDTSIKNPYV